MLRAAVLGTLLAAAALVGCGADSDEGAGAAGSSMVPLGGVGGAGLGGAGMGGAGMGGAGMAGAGLGGAGGAGMAAQGAVQFPFGFEDWPVIGIANREEQGFQPDGVTPRDAGIRIIVGNDRAVAAARSGNVVTWPEGSVLVGIVWSDAGNAREPADMVAPGQFRLIQVMEKSSSRFAATGNWGYGAWQGDSLTLRAPDASCYDCHNQLVADKDFVFTRPLDMPSPAEIAAAAPSPNGISLPIGFTEWRFVAVHNRLRTPEMRIVLGNDTAIEAIRAGTTNPWPDGTMLADIISPAVGNAAWSEMFEPGDRSAVAFMLRDSERFASQGNWGYGVWRGADELAAGDDISACVNCHVSTPGVPGNDYVFTDPAVLPPLP